MPGRRDHGVRAASGSLVLAGVNIVVVVSGGLTETLQAAPLIAALGSGSGEPVLLAAPPASRDVAAGLAGAGELLSVGGLAGRPNLAGAVGLWLALRNRRLDAAVLCSESAWVRAAVYLSGVPRRVGCGGGLSGRLLSDRVACIPGDSRVRAWLQLCTPLRVAPGELQGTFGPGEEANARAEELLLSTQIGDGRPLVAIAPGAGFGERAQDPWPSERFAHLANRLAARHGAAVVLVGDERDRPLSEAVRLDMTAPALDLCGELDLPTTAAVIARCDLLIGSDTPLLHLAAGVRTTSIGIFGPTDGRVRSPAGPEHRVIQALDNGHSSASLDRIRVDDVLAGIETAL